MNDNATGQNPIERLVRPHRTPTRAEVEALMKRCQIGVGGRDALETAHEIMADCYGTLGLLMSCAEWNIAALAELQKHYNDLCRENRPSAALYEAHTAELRESAALWEERARHLGWRDEHGA